jgi:hypothetical protein
MLTRERSGAPPFLKLSAIGLTSYRCIIIGWKDTRLLFRAHFAFCIVCIDQARPTALAPRPIGSR